jgi:hypothetical protein
MTKRKSAWSGEAAGPVHDAVPWCVWMCGGVCVLSGAWCVCEVCVRCVCVCVCVCVCCGCACSCVCICARVCVVGSPAAACMRTPSPFAVSLASPHRPAPSASFLDLDGNNDCAWGCCRNARSHEVVGLGASGLGTPKTARSWTVAGASLDCGCCGQDKVYA